MYDNSRNPLKRGVSTRLKTVHSGGWEEQGAVSVGPVCAAIHMRLIGEARNVANNALAKAGALEYRHQHANLAVLFVHRHRCEGWIAPLLRIIGMTLI